MKIETLVLGPLDTNCYIVSKDGRCLIIDPAFDSNLIINACKKYKVDGILVTHHHPDHIGALKEIEKFYNLKHNDNNNSFNYEVIKTPGHTDDSITFYFKEENIMFTGDFIFYHTIGRCDFVNSNINDMKKSLQIIKKYNDNIIIYPGHGKFTILGEEKIRFDFYF